MESKLNTIVVDELWILADTFALHTRHVCYEIGKRVIDITKKDRRSWEFIQCNSEYLVEI